VRQYPLDILNIEHGFLRRHDCGLCAIGHSSLA
jgi:hypothetical protein